MPDDTALILQRLARIEALLETEAQRCPYQSDIARAMNSISERKALAGRVDKIEDRLTDARISIARMLATGGAGGVIGTVLVEMVKGLIEAIP